MKKIIMCIVTCLCLSLVLFSQEYSDLNINKKPTSSWPFYFNDFVEATVSFNDNNSSVKKTSVNINLFTGELQYIDNSGVIRILENIEEVHKITVGNNLEFVFVDGFTQRVVLESNNYLITQQAKGNIADVQDSKGAYGGSTATSSVNSVEGKLIGGVNNFDYTYMIENKGGTSFKPEIRYYLKGKDFEMILNKRNIKKYFPSNYKEIISFIKSEKLSLKNEESFPVLLNYLEEL